MAGLSETVDLYEGRWLEMSGLGSFGVGCDCVWASISVFLEGTCESS